MVLFLSVFFGGCAQLSKINKGDSAWVLSETLDWPQVRSDLTVDPAILFGRLENGFGYVLKTNQTPKDRVSMHLYVRTGSLNEAESQQGIAHFLEHMAFNGSTHFQPGEMVKFFQRIGMQFGPDANAHTGFTQTVYDILLPEGDDKSIREGFQVLQDYAMGALLKPDEVDKERGVVLAEMRARDTVDYRTMKAVFDFEMPDALLARRMPIGKKEIIQRIDDSDLRAFYDGWYRPERMILVMVGDFQVEKALPMIERAFGSIEDRAPLPMLPDFGKIRHEGDKVFYHFEREAGNTGISIETIATEKEPSDSLESRRQAMLRDLAVQIVQSRLDALVQSSDSPMTSSRIHAGYFLSKVRYAEINADCNPANWRPALQMLEQQLRKALVYGFLPSELDRAKKDLLASLQRDAQESNTRQSQSLAREIISDLSALRVTMSPAQQLALMEPMIAAATVQQVSDAFKNSWAENHRLIIVTGNAAIDSPEQQIMSAYQESRMIAVNTPVEKQAPVFPYLPKPSKEGTVLKRSLYEDIGIGRIEFGNGLTLFHKRTVFEEKKVMAALSFGSGKQSEPAEQPGLAELAEMVINASGFGGMDSVTLEKALAGRLARVHLEVREDVCVLIGKAPTEELPLLIQQMYAFLKDPGFRHNALALSLKRYKQQYDALRHQVDGMMAIEGKRRLAGNDSRFGLSAFPELQRISLEQIESWFDEQLGDGPMELAVVGDFDVEDAVAQTAETVGALPAAHAGKTPAGRSGPVFPRGEIVRLSVESVLPKALVVVAYPTDDFWHIRRTRRLSVLAEVMSERLRVRIRERLGAVYSPFAFNRSYRAYPGYGLLQIFMTVDPKLADSLLQEVRRIADVLVREGVQQDEFERVIGPTLTSIKDLRQENTYWLNSVLIGAGRHPEQLDWSRSIEKDYASITVEDIDKLAVEVFDNSKSAAVIITPSSTSSDQ